MYERDNTKELMREADSFKRLAFYAITISSIATITAVIFVPLFYSYVQHVHSSLDIELDFCRHRTSGLWEEYRRVMGTKAERTKREAMHRASGFTGFSGRRAIARNAFSLAAESAVSSYGTDANVSGGEASSQDFCSCDVGLAGPPGSPGTDGNNG